MAIQPDFGAMQTSEWIAVLQSWKEKEFFDTLGSIVWMLAVKDIHEVPTDLHTRLPASKIFLCIPESVCATKENQTLLKHFTTNGFKILTDQFASSLELAWSETKYFAMDASNTLPFFAKSWTTRLASGQHWAKNISTHASLDQAVQAGFKMLSGEYPFNPPATNKSADGTARTRLLKLLGLVSRDADSHELEELFKQDPSLSFMLFKLVSSAAFAQTVRVSSFGQAINLLGRRQLQRWLQLLLYARSQDAAGALNPLMTRAAFRASMMEALCQKNGGSKDEQDAAFMVGIFSLLDKLFGSDLGEVLHPLSLKDEVLAALLHRTGILGSHLRLVELADRPHTVEIETAIRRAEVSINVFEESLVQAYAWVNQVCREA
ncbi:EAL and HDOD domain-containing protein [Undibacterium sp. RuRC25W]|uniref:EAL and HDOD domain-containing protein n=1 Tax=Undibacterium sp. RuRC25W TaxID=3413047 RepID=UPI003BEFBCBE